MAASIKFIKTHNALKLWGESFVEKIKAQMNIDKTVASGKTRDSVAVEVVNTTLYLKSEAKGKYAILDLIDKGFHPSKPPPVEGPDGIMQWMKDKNIQPKRKNRFVSRTETNYKRSAHAISRSISQKGAILRYNRKGSNILDFTFKNMEKRFEDIVLGGFEADVNDFLEKNTKRVVK